jgi:hypothetical protein
LLITVKTPSLWDCLIYHLTLIHLPNINQTTVSSSIYVTERALSSSLPHITLLQYHNNYISHQIKATIARSMVTIIEMGEREEAKREEERETRDMRFQA